MYTNDFFMRQIEGLTEVIAKVVFHKDTEKEQIINAQNQISDTGLFRHTLFRMLAEGQINEAEDLLHERLASKPNRKYFTIALDFYQELACLSDETLLQNNFSREEIMEGLQAVQQYAAQEQ